MKFIINSENFDKKLDRIIRDKGCENVINGRFDMESIEFSDRVDFIMSFLVSFNDLSAVTYKILFWEENELYKEFFRKNFPDINYKLTKGYKNGKIPGNIFIDDTEIEDFFLREILNRHLNYEMALIPSFNMRLQICMNLKKIIILVDIYDDRGFYIYVIENM